MVDPKQISLTFTEENYPEGGSVTVSLDQILNGLGFEYGFSESISKVMSMVGNNPIIKIEVI